MLRVGIIGYGFVTKTFHLPLIGATQGIEVRAICSSRPDVVRAAHPGLAVVETPQELVARDDLDVVLIASTNDTHAPWARLALEAGKHVIVEKPFALDLAQARKLVAAADAAGRIITVFQNRRWDSDFLSVKAAIEQGSLGRVVQFESHFDRFQPSGGDRWWEKQASGSGIWFDLAPHLVDQALQLFGLPGSVQVNLASLRDGSLVDDWAHAVLNYPHLRVILHASTIVSGGSPRFIVHGDGGSLIKPRLDDQENQLLRGIVPGSASWGSDPDQILRWATDGTLSHDAPLRGDQRGFYRALVAAVEQGAPPPVRPHEAIAVMAIIEAGFASSAQGRAVVPDLTPAERAGWTR